MKKLKSKKEILEALAKEDLIHRDTLSTDYEGLYFECAKGGKHLVDEDITRSPDMQNTGNHGAMVCAKPVKFLFRCNHDLLTFVRIKGMLSQTTIEEWYFELKHLDEVSEEADFIRFQY